MTADYAFSSILRTAREYSASDVHLITGLPPAFRVNGEIIVADEEPMSRDQLRALAGHLLSPAKAALLEKERELCFSSYHEDWGRIRLSFYHRLEVPEMAIRLCNLEVKSASELMLPTIVNDLALKSSGLVLVTGPTGMGKSTTLNYMIDLINSTRRGKIITIEDPVEFEHTHRKSIVVQIEVGTDTTSFLHCLRHVLRMDPDVICIGEMRDLDTMETALTAAETGHLVFATLHTPSAYGTIERIVSAFDGPRQPQVILQLASVLQGVIAQRLLPCVDKSHRVLATEVLVATLAVRNIIRENNLHQLRNAMLTSRKEGAHTIEDSLSSLYQRGVITIDQAKQNASVPSELDRVLNDKVRSYT